MIERDDSVSDSWDEQTEEYLAQMITDTEKSIIFHNNREILYNIFKNVFGIMAIVLSGVMSVLTDSSQEIIVRMCFLSLSILSSINHFMAFSKQQYKHKKMSIEYQLILSKMRRTQALKRDRRKSCRGMLTVYSTMLDNVRRQGLPTPVGEQPSSPS